MQRRALQQATGVHNSPGGGPGLPRTGPGTNFGPMATADRERRRGFWTTILVYGASLAALVVLLKYVEYRYLLRELRMEVYIGVVAVLFTALGIWVGTKVLEGRRQGQADAPAVVPQQPSEAALRHSGISARELEVLVLMAEGRSNQEIADQLFISLPTVKSHSSSLFGKLDVRRRTEAVHRAKSLGIIA